MRVCANILGRAPLAVLIADRASRVTVKAIASHSECTGARTVGRMRVLMIAPTFLVVHHHQFCFIADRASRVTVKAIALRASHSECTDHRTGLKCVF